MIGFLKFFVWSNSTSNLGWLFGMAVRIAFWVVLFVVAMAVLNPHNPAFKAADRAELESEAHTYTQTGTRPQRWEDLLHSASAECHYRSAKPQEFIISGTLSDQYIEPNSGIIRWYVRFRANLTSLTTMFGPAPFTINLVTMQTFYGIVRTDGFVACSAGQALNAHNILGL